MSYIPNTPSQGGYLPYYLLFTSAASIYGVLQSYFSIWQTRELYSKKSSEITPLAGRIFGTWNGTVTLIRLVAAYNLHLQPTYDLAMGAYIIAVFHFTTELIFFRSCKIGKVLAVPMTFAIVGLTWMTLQRDYYLGL